MPTYLLSSGEAIELPVLPEPVAAFLARVQSAAENPATTPADLLALVYGVGNPLLDTATSPGHAIIRRATLEAPAFRVLADLVFRKQLAAAGKTTDDAFGAFTVSVHEAAEQLGITESSVRAAIVSRKLAAYKRNGQWYTRPEAVAAYKVSNRGRKRTAEPEPTDAAVRVRCGSADGGSLAVRIDGGELVTQAKDGGAVLGRFPAHWTHALVKTTTKQGVRVFAIEPAEDTEEITHLGLYVRGPFRIARKINNTKEANAIWKASAAMKAG